MIESIWYLKVLKFVYQFDLFEPSAHDDDHNHKEFIVIEDANYDQGDVEDLEKEVKINDYLKIFVDLKETVQEEFSGSTINSGTSATEINEILNRFQAFDKNDS